MSTMRGISFALAMAAAALPLAGAAPTAEARLREARSYFEPLPVPPPLTDRAQIARVELGRKLYLDAQLSAKGNVSCNSCHDLANYGVDSRSVSPGDDGQLGARNSPTVFNAALHASQFWDGRAADVEEQAGMPILNPVEMAMPDPEVLMARLAHDLAYLHLFGEAFPGPDAPFSYENLRRAIGAFERRLITPGRFDAYLRGDASALSAPEQAGMLAFVDVGCANCHDGAIIGAGTLQKFGLMEPYWQQTGSQRLDEGVAAQTHRDADRYFFKVASLRNVSETGPYFHDGSVNSLAEAVRVMGKVQLGAELTAEECEQIVAFLRTLTGKVPPAAKL